MTSTPYLNVRRPFRHRPCARSPLGLLVRALALLAVAAGVLTVLVAPSTAKAAPRPVHAGLGYRLRGDFVGFYVTSTGTKVYCLDPDKAAPSGISLHTVARYPGSSAAASSALGYALWRWGDARTTRQAAVESQVLNTLVGNTSAVHRRSRHLPASLRAVVAAHVRAARLLRGPHSLRVTLPTSLLPGQAATGSAVVTSAGGHRMPHLRLRMTSTSNAAVTRTAVTDHHGVAHFTYRVTAVGTVHVGATGRGLAPTGLRTSHPGRGHQHLVSWSGPTSLHGSASFATSPAGFTGSYGCTTTCAGRPRVSLRACAAPNRDASRMVYRVAERSITVEFPASPSRRCRSIDTVLRDGDRVSGSWQFRTSHGWTRPVAAGGAFTVDCPPVPGVGVSMVYDCSRARVTIGLAAAGAGASWTPLVNGSRHRMVLVIAGATDRRVYAGHGERAIFTASASCRSPQTYDVRAGVQRANGQYNYGAQASVTTPGR